MPYVVTTKRPPLSFDPFNPRATPERVSRRAVTTLEEARAAVITALVELAAPPTAFSIDESGGTIGPLPDGTLIEVERVHLSALYPKAMYGRAGEWRDEAKVIAAYNAREAA
jgi:hypothetical protein